MFQVDTEYPVALASFDHLTPAGTMLDSYSNLDFNAKLLALFKADELPISVLDIGCAGGGMVETFVNQGQIAIGIEGSDYSLKRKRAAWAHIPENLFTADATKPFTVHTGDHEPYQFDVITVWEFMEHIERKDLRAVLQNITRHLKPSGMLIGTINTRKALRHRTVEPTEFWFDLLRNYGLTQNSKLVRHFGEAWVRNCGGAFRIAMQRS